LQQERAGVLAEILALATRSRLDVDGVSARRYHVGQIDVACLHIASERQQLALVIDEIRAELVLADQNVKSLDQLQTRQHAEFDAVQLQREQREREDIWQAGQLGRRTQSGDQS
jgi:flagellar biosynthesis chaperone FliJ